MICCWCNKKIGTQPCPRCGGEQEWSTDGMVVELAERQYGTELKMRSNGTYLGLLYISHQWLHEFHMKNGFSADPTSELIAEFVKSNDPSCWPKPARYWPDIREMWERKGDIWLREGMPVWP